MEDQDKIYSDFKEASEKAEAKGFNRMEAVWNRVEQKLDNKKKRRTSIYWKCAGVAAVLLLCLTVGTFIFRNEGQPVTPNVLPENNVTVIDTQKVKDAFDPVKEKQGEVVVNDEATDETSKIEDSVYFMKNARFTTSNNINNSKYYFKSKKLTPIIPSSQNTSIGYFEEARTEPYVDNSANAATTGTSETIQGQPNASYVQSLQGQVPVLKISTGTGQPGATGTVAGRTMKDGNRQSFVAADPEKTYDGNENIVLKGNPIAARTDNNTRIFTSRSVESEIKSVQGQPGSSNTTVVLRGVSSINSNVSPLYVIDGVPSNFDAFRKLHASKIKSVSVLKDSRATSIYGNRGANGVVVVETSRTKKEKRKDRKQQQSMAFAPIESKPTARFIAIDTEEYESFEENKFENPATTPLSTFSIDVDNASYTNMRRFLNNGQTVPKDAVRVEEMINFFKYQYPQPKGDAPFSINTEYSDAPWNPKHKLLKIGLKGKEIPSAELPASNFVFLIDVSGSMNSDNKLPLLKQSMKLLVNQMRKEDRIAIVVYAGAAGLVLPSTSGAEKDKIIAALDNLSAGGSTAGGEGIELAYKTAQENFIKKGNNRVILATDGDFNVGPSTDKDMQALIEEKRKSGVFLTCLGYGMGNYKDSKLEILSDKGNGNYAYIDNMQEATRFLNKEFKGSMYAIAKDVKIQIEFNPKHVQSYRLIGYENRKLRDEDFVNDAIDAGELGSGHTVTALYEIIPAGVESEFFPVVPQLKYSTPQTATGNYADELAAIKFRHKKPDEDKSKEIVQVIPNVAVKPDEASGDFKFAAAVAWFGLKLRDSKLIPNKETEAIRQLATQGLQNDPEGYRAEFVRLVDMVK
jgi:Ca-activated chloride channel family protein